MSSQPPTGGFSGFGRFPEPDRPVPTPPPGWPQSGARPPAYPQRQANPRPGPQPPPRGSVTPPVPGRDFVTPVELHCVLRPESEMKRAIPMLIFTFIFAGLVAAVVVGIAAPKSGVVPIVAGVVVGAAASGAMYARMRSRLTRTYGTLQRLVVTPRGLQRTDGTVTNDMPWATMQRIETRNSSMPGKGVNVRRTGMAGAGANAVIGAAHTKIATGIVGRSTLTPLPGGNRTQLKVHDQVSGGRSNLRGGQPYVTEQGLIFPGEFEEDWLNGVVGAWLRHYRPDIALPARA